MQYDHYYTSVDVNVYLVYKATNLRIHIDKCIGIGYNHNVSSMPVYTLGNVDPTFFTRGNSLVQGNMDLAFKSTAYLQKGLKYLLNKGSLKNEKDTLINKISNKEYTDEDVARLALLQRMTITDMETISITSILELFDIVIEFNNNNSSESGSGTSTLTIESAKFMSFSGSVHSAQENVLVDRYSFLAKNVS